MPSPPWDRLDQELVRSALLGHSNFSLEPSGRSAAVTVLLVPAASGIEVLLIRRSARSGDPWSGHMALPGGFRAAADADLLATAIRETREEVGIDLSPAFFVGRLGDVSPAVNNVTVRPFVFVRDRVPEVVTSQEVQAATWVALDSVASGSSRASHELELDGSRHRFPGFQVGEHVVWGMTYRVLMELVELMGRAFSQRGAPPKSALPGQGEALETIVPTGRRH